MYFFREIRGCVLCLVARNLFIKRLDAALAEAREILHVVAAEPEARVGMRRELRRVGGMMADPEHVVLKVVRMGGVNEVRRL